MRGEARRPRWVVLWMAAALFATGCATLPPLLRAGDPHGPAEVLRDEPVSGAHSAQTHSVATTWEKRARVRLRRRHGAPVVGIDVAVVSAEEMALRQAPGAQPSPQGPPSCGGQAAPEGWPDYSSWWDEELLAPFFQCTSPGEFLALQRRVDMPRLVEALDDWNAVRLGALGPMEDGAAQVLQRKRLSFLVTATRKYGAHPRLANSHHLFDGRGFSDGKLKDREIRTFYEADFRDPDPFAAAVELARSLGGKP